MNGFYGNLVHSGTECTLNEACAQIELKRGWFFEGFG